MNHQSIRRFVQYQLALIACSWCWACVVEYIDYDPAKIPVLGQPCAANEFVRKGVDGAWFCDSAKGEKGDMGSPGIGWQTGANGIDVVHRLPGWVGIGTEAPADFFDVVRDENLRWTIGADLIGTRAGSRAQEPMAVILRRSTGENQNPSDIRDGDEIGVVEGQCRVSDTWVTSANIRFLADGTVSRSMGGNAPGSIIFSTTPDQGPNGPYVGIQERMKIDEAGNVGIGTMSPDHKLDVGGDIRASGDLSTGGSAFLGQYGYAKSFDLAANGSGSTGDFAVPPGFTGHLYVRSSAGRVRKIIAIGSEAGDCQLGPPDGFQMSAGETTEATNVSVEDRTGCIWRLTGLPMPGQVNVFMVGTYSPP